MILVLLKNLSSNNGKLAVLEDNCEIGGLADIVRHAISEASINAEILSFAYPDKGIEHGKKSDIERAYKMDSESIADKILSYWSGMEKA